MPEKPCIVVSLGGSFLFSKMGSVKKLKALLLEMDLHAVLVVGGGKLARRYIDFGKRMGIEGNKLHEIGIKSTMLNAFIISEYFGCSYYSGDPREIGSAKGTVATGGYKPGWTTDVCAAYACISRGSKVLFNISKERGVFDKDPGLFKEAKLIHHMGFADLYKLVMGNRKPGMNFIFDPMAAKICEKNGIDVVVTNSVEDIRRYIEGATIKGTIVHG
ncbi:MAG: hypothetical protein QXR73_00065 [Candidatus Micrarchaeaceae archaeon]